MPSACRDKAREVPDVLRDNNPRNFKSLGREDHISIQALFAGRRAAGVTTLRPKPSSHPQSWSCEGKKGEKLAQLIEPLKPLGGGATTLKRYMKEAPTCLIISDFRNTNDQLVATGPEKIRQPVADHLVLDSTVVTETRENVGVEKELHQRLSCTRRLFSSSSTSGQSSSSPSSSSLHWRKRATTFR